MAAARSRNGFARVRASPALALQSHRRGGASHHALLKEEMAEPSAPLARQCAAEVFGTFALVFAGTGAVIIDGVTNGGVTHVGVALTFGLIVLAMIFAVGDVSGAHLNPAVTLGFVAARRLPVRRALPYVTSQLAGAFLASGLLKMMFPAHETLGATLPFGSALQSFVLEAVLTAILMFVILSIAHGAQERGLLAAVAVGGVIALEALFAGPISGASMNPARSLAPAVVSGELHALWVYLLAPPLGALIAVPLARLIFASPEPDDLTEAARA
jgi:aquaporin Z